MQLFKLFLPEIFLSCCILTQLVVNIKLIKSLKYNYPIIIKEVNTQVIFILVCVLLLLLNSEILGYSSDMLFTLDASSTFLKSLVVIFFLSISGFVYKNLLLQRINFFEYYIILSLSILSALLLISVSDLVSLYLVIEMQALCAYILTSVLRRSAFSVEAGLKYFIMGAFISCIFLFGCSLIYGSLGTTNFNVLSLLYLYTFDGCSFDIILFSVSLVGWLLVFITLFFKLTAAPFHFWAPDVYEGSALASTIFFAIVPKVALFTVLLRILIVLSDNFLIFKPFFLFIGLLSIFFGAIFAINQSRIKRFIIYSSVAQIGFLLACISSNLISSIQYVYFFLFIYLISASITWGFISFLYNFKDISKNFFASPANFYNKSSKLSPFFLTSFVSFMQYNKLWAYLLAFLFFSFAGIPPFVGFWSKYLIIKGLLLDNIISLGLFLLVFAAWSTYYYIRIIKITCFERKDLFSSSITLTNSEVTSVFQGKSSSWLYLSMTFLSFLLIFFSYAYEDFLLFCEFLALSFNF